MRGKEDRYKVVIECATYNQREYIEDALKGFVMQKTSFPFCALIIDDCSTDGQQDIILRYAQKYPEIIIPILLPYNHYQAKESKQKYFEPYFQESKYIAKCEGDDYWIDDHKLQKQVDFLEDNPDCALTYHACINKFEDNFIGQRIPIGENVKTEYRYDELLQSYPFQTATIMMRSSVWFNPFFQKCYSILSYSSIQFFAASQLGAIKGFNEGMSVYRRNNTGISADIKTLSKITTLFERWSNIASLCNPEVSNYIHKKTVRGNLYLMHKLSFKTYLKYCLKEAKTHPSVVSSTIVSILKTKVANLRFIQKR